MQSLISNGCVKQYYLYVVLIRNNIRCINNIQEMELHTKKCHKWIDVDFRKIQKQISSHLDYGWRRKTWYKIWLQIKRGKANCSSFEQTWPRPFISDECLLIIVSFAHLNLFNKRSALPFALYPLLRLSPSSSPSQPRLCRRYGSRL
jgi:hypothetical protein